jgi:phage gp45-like
MHRATPANSSFRAFSAGGARALISKITDSSLMQEVGASLMKGEVRKAIEAVHQYGFTSVPFAPDEEKDGKPGLGPEAFVSFIGGNRSFPVMGPVDDRRHRLKDLEAGDVALFRGRDDGQQFHMNGVGTFLSTFPGKKLRMQIVARLAQVAGGARAFAEGDQAAGDAAQQQKGQKAVYKNEAAAFFEVDDAATESLNKKHHIRLPDGTAVILKEVDGVGVVYLGGDPDKGGTFLRVLCQGNQLAENVYAKVG